jgi:hypothetical protein
VNPGKKRRTEMKKQAKDSKKKQAKVKDLGAKKDVKGGVGSASLSDKGAKKIKSWVQ